MYLFQNVFTLVDGKVNEKYVIKENRNINWVIVRSIKDGVMYAVSTCIFMILMIMIM